MPIRTVPLIKDHYYHVFNRGVEKRSIHLDRRDYVKALFGINYYRFANTPTKLSIFKSVSKERLQLQLNDLISKNEKLVDIISFVLMPNHFHLLLRQNTDNGISIFLRKWLNSYTRYFNLRHNRVGPLFQGSFKAVHIESTEQLLHVSRYIHLNPVTSAIIRDNQMNQYLWSSYLELIEGKSNICSFESILEHFSSIDEYKNFVLDYKDYAKELNKIKHLILD